ncbi:MAG: TonB-dependent receptor [Muribaculaceae bacterium]|nr:TonB-dependent receptor [Muribaculaceae bacterium]
MRATAITICAACACTAAAQTASLTDAQLDSLERAWARELNTVVVTGTRTPKLLKDSPILTRVISEADIRKADATNISDLLQTELPGIEFSYSMNQQVNLNMQGFGGNSVLFLVDGERLAGETLDNVDYNRLNLAGAGRIEIVKGGASALYGSNAVGGVVNIISSESADPWRLNLNARYGAHNEQRYGAALSLNRGRVSSSTTAQFHHIDSYDMDGPGDYTRFYGGYNWSVKERLTWTPVDRLKLIARAGYYFRQRNAQAASRDRYRDLSAGLRGIYTFSPASDLELCYGFDEYDKSDYLRMSGRDVRKYSNVQNSLRAIFNHTFGGRHILTAGADVMHDYLQSYQFADGGVKEQTTADVLAQFDMNFTDRLNIIAGGRYDYFSEAGMQHLSARLSTKYTLGRVNLRGCYSGGFRAPTLKEMYMDFDMAGIFMIYGNPELKPESSHNFQLSAEYTRNLLNFNVGGFCNLVDNRITTAWNQALGGQMYTNIGRVNIAGLDANLSWRYRCGAGTRLSYIYTHEHVRHGEPYTASTRPHTATMRFDYTRRWGGYGLTAALSGRVLSAVTVDEYTSLTDYSDTEKVRYPAYTMWKLNVSQTVLQGLTVTLSVDNLFNYVPKYYYNNSPTTNGITFAAGVSVDIEEFFKKK